ncbi:hypothetical protein [Maribacter sp. LLG6340-A2]|uniref:hypothetical protein n=1 Tax=Maribacter sp. LLG6340-A2 TaxID=3160834 RepID=UPI00386DDAFF
MEKSLWFKILYYWCFKKNPIGSGLTIPFLIGVEKEFGRGQNFETNDLLNEFYLIQVIYSITIRNCQNINMIVCCLDILNNQEKEYYKNFGSIYLEVNDYNDLKTFEDFKLKVKSEYIDYIQQNNYSINNGIWGGFTDIDLKTIEKIM